jgi:hypothetical protein
MIGLEIKIFILSDSHGYGVCEALMRLDSTAIVRTVSVGSTTRYVWSEYQEQRASIQSFSPDALTV